MYLVRRQYRVDPSKMDEIARGVQGLIPILRKAPGFVAYTVAKLPDGVGSLSLFETKAQADESVKLAASYVKEHLAAVLPTPPEVTGGEVLAHATGPAGAGTKPPLHGTRRRYTVDAGKVAEIGRHVREGFIPLISKAPGFVRYVAVGSPEGLTTYSLFEKIGRAHV